MQSPLLMWRWRRRGWPGYPPLLLPRVVHAPQLLQRQAGAGGPFLRHKRVNGGRRVRLLVRLQHALQAGRHAQLVAVGERQGGLGEAAQHKQQPAEDAHGCGDLGSQHINEGSGVRKWK